MGHGVLARAWPGLAVAAVGLTALVVVLIVDAPPAGPDASQIQAGWTAYATHCAACHGSSLDGGAGPALNRSGLHNRFPTALDLYVYIKERMPVDGVGPGGLSDADYLALTAAILDDRGVPHAGVLDLAAAAATSLVATTTPAPAERLATTVTVPAGARVPTRAPSGNTPPLAPTLVEPAEEVLWRGPSPFFITMQTSGFVDADPGDQHLATEFEIRHLTEFELVWTAMVTTEPLDQAALEQGAFTGPLAGRVGLKHESRYLIRARHRDASGDPLSEWSAWSPPVLFWTVSQDGAFPRPLRVRDIQSDGVRWESVDGVPVALGAGNALLITGVAGELLEITGESGNNAVRDLPPAARYLSVFFRFEAGPEGLEVPESTLSFLDATGIRRAAWLPWIKLDPGAVLIAAPTSAGAFYFEPDDSLAGRTDTEPEFFTHSRARSPALPWRAAAGFRVELVADGFALPVQMAAVPSPANDPDAPVAYITELHGSVKALGSDGSVWTYATDVLNQRLDEPPSRPPGEAGTSGIAVDPVTGDVYVSTVYIRDGELHNKIVRLQSDDGGRTAARAVDVLRMDDEVTSTSHQIHGLIFGHDDALYAAVGDAWEQHRAADDAYFGGKVLRMNRDGSAPPDNPHFDPAQPDAPVSYQWAKGFRNIFALAQRPEDNAIHLAENGLHVDRLVRVEAGDDHGWPYEALGRDHLGLVLFGPPGFAPVGMAFASGGVFPASRQGNLYLGGFGDGYTEGPVDAGKEIWEIRLDESGALVRPPTVFVKYLGDGFTSVTGVAYLPDGLYFLEFFAEHPAEGNPGAPGARLWRVVPDTG